MPTVPEELDVFCVPHNHMKKLVQDMEHKLSRMDFHDAQEYLMLLQELSGRFHEFKSHEEIENNYILSPLLPRLSKCSKTKLIKDIHSDNRLHDLMTLIDSTPLLTNEQDRIRHGEHLKLLINEFTVDFIPHMNEEEEVFLPLLLEHYSEMELKTLTQTVMQLHNLNMKEKGCTESEATPTTAQKLKPQEVTSVALPAPSLISLPPEVLLKISSYLGPQDLCRLSQVHSSLSNLVFDGSLWSSLHPVRWAEGHWNFFSPFIQAEDELTHEVITEYDVTKHLLACGNSVNAAICRMYDDDSDYSEGDYEDVGMEREEKVMIGFLENLLPKVGEHVKVLDLAYGKSLTCEMAYRILQMCPNIRYLDLSHTKVTDYSFRGLVDPGGTRTCLQYIDISGCSMITDTTLLRIAWACSPTSPTSSLCSNCSCGQMIEDTNMMRVKEETPQLKGLVLSGCHHVTDVGLKSLAIGCGLPNLQYLNLTGLARISAAGLNKLVSACPRLKPELLFYCDNIQNGPHAYESNGCCNVENGYQCCQNLYQT